MRIKNKRVPRENAIKLIRLLREAGNIVEVKDVHRDYIDIVYFNPTPD